MVILKHTLWVNGRLSASQHVFKEIEEALLWAESIDFGNIKIYSEHDEILHSSTHNHHGKHEKDRDDGYA